MEYFNLKDKRYLSALKDSQIEYTIKIELLSKYETTIGEITRAIDYENSGQINVNYNQIVRRSCSLSVVNVDNKYIPSPVSCFWYNRKFKLWIGVVVNDDIYWFSQGVYYTKSATGDAHRINIEAVDKGGALNGDLKMNLINTKTTYQAGSTIADIIRNTLITPLMNYDVGGKVIGGDNILDSVPPLIDSCYESQILMADITLDQNSYVSKLFEDIANGYGADIYYDTEGRLVITRQADIFFVDGYLRQGRLWEFSDLSSVMGSANYSYSLDAVNAVTVYTDDSKQEYVSATVYNENPVSPCRVGAIGLRRAESQQIAYINVGADEMRERCRQYGVLFLLKESMKGMSLNFNSPLMPHFDVNKVIGVTDTTQNINNASFVIQSLTIPFGNKPMSISATNIEWLPLDKMFREG